MRTQSLNLDNMVDGCLRDFLDDYEVAAVSEKHRRGGIETTQAIKRTKDERSQDFDGSTGVINSFGG